VLLDRVRAPNILISLLQLYASGSRRATPMLIIRLARFLIAALEAFLLASRGIQNLRQSIIDLHTRRPIIRHTILLHLCVLHMLTVVAGA
jgi:hypothetical protein